MSDNTNNATIDPSIEQLLADCGGADAQAIMDSAGGDWFPPGTGTKQNPGTYDFLGLKIEANHVNKYVQKGDQKTYTVLNLPMKVLTPGESEGRDANKALFLGGKMDAGTLKELAGLLGYNGTDWQGMIRHVVANFADHVYTVAVYLATNKKDPTKPYTNISFLSAQPTS